MKGKVRSFSALTIHFTGSAYSFRKLILTASGSLEKVNISAINAYLDLQTEEERKDAFLQEVRNIVQEELRANPVMGMMPYFQPPAEKKPTQETEDAMLAFLDAFDGE